MENDHTDLFQKLSEDEFRAALPVSTESLKEAARRGEEDAAKWEEEHFGRELPESSLAMRFR